MGGGQDENGKRMEFWKEERSSLEKKVVSSVKRLRLSSGFGQCPAG